MHINKKVIIGVAVATAAVATATGVAVAVWSASGTGPGGAAAGVAQSLTVTAVTPTGAAANMYPGGPAGTVYFSISNPNPYAVTVTGITWGTPVSNNVTTCPSSNVSIDTNAPKTGLSISIPANGNTGGAIAEPGVLDLSHAAPDGCQGVSFTVPLTATGTEQ
jgi:hypothetical protein